ncbi:hypothetical protein GCM10017621_14220 [Maricaulis virginensis]|uniref:Uncharacterized protein n=2 Tax=Maricaulis virginensis TaxID=144022 RepID=A0A9W6MNI7_9PROT|nr:hypothetical protein GCM10017621_14220 [Maricaulis virginensis]
MQRADILQVADGGGIMPDWLPPILGTLDIAAFAALIIGVMWNARETRRSTYINLETEALNIFRFEAEHRAVLARIFNEPEDRPVDLDDEETVVANNYFLQILNLFEIAVRLRSRGNLDPMIFGTWVSWFLEVSEMGWFRRNWPDYRLHYSPDMRGIFDTYFRTVPDLSIPFEERRKHFFEAAAKQMRCRTVRKWLDNA